MATWAEGRPRRAAPATAPRRELLAARPVRLWHGDELEVLRAVAWMGIEQGATDGVWRPELRRRLEMTRPQIGRLLRRLSKAGALERSALRTARAYRLTDAGLATLATEPGALQAPQHLTD